MRAVAITGASGFVGRHLLARLPSDQPLVALSRRPASPAWWPGNRPAWRVVPGDLTDAATLSTSLAGADLVVHLAAVTGKTSRRRHVQVNLEGTRSLLAAAREAGVRRLIMVSSIAAGFADRRFYHYAEAKRAAEETVRQSGLDFAIVRPTMVFGPGSAVQTGLTRLATAPVGLIFGSGEVPVQPIHVDDLADLLVALMQREPLGGRVWEAGGPEVLTVGQLLGRIRQAEGRGPGPFMHLPLAPLRTVLGLLEPWLLPLLPFTAGQLASFANPGTARPPGEGMPVPRHGVDAMLAHG